MATNPRKETPASRLIAAIHARGSDAVDLRDAAHEACHAIRWNVPGKWTRKKITAANPYKSRRMFSFGLADEITARAVEQIVCKRLGYTCATVEQCVLIMCMETLTYDRIELKFEEMKKAIEDRMESPQAAQLADQVIALVASDASTVPITRTEAAP